MDANLVVNAALHAASISYPYLSSVIFGMPLHEERRIPTAGVSMNGRLYYNPDFMMSLAGNKDALVFVVAHEALHLVLEHHKRAAAYGDTLNHDLWNVAADLEINQVISGREPPIDGVLMPESFGLPHGKSAEYYYSALVAEAERHCTCGEGDDSCDGDGSDGRPADGADDCPLHGSGRSGGSASDGQWRDWETHGADGDAERVANAVHAAHREIASRYAGSVPSSIRRYVSGRYVVSVPIDVRLYGDIAGAMSRHDYTDLTYARPNVRCADSDFVLPSAVCYEPRVVLIADTSGSMSDDDLGVVLAVARRLLAQCGAIKFVPFDCDEHGVYDIMGADDIKDMLIGGGGTDMAKAIQYAVDNVRDCSVIFVVTDGYTGWPAERPLGVDVVVYVTKYGTTDSVPSWAKVHQLEE